MRFATKVTLLLAAVSAVPVAASGVISATMSSDAVRGQTGALQAALAAQTAAHVESWFARVVDDLRRATRYLPLGGSSRDEVAALLRLPFRQLDDVTALVLLDGRGQAIVAPVHVATVGPVPDDLGRRPRLQPADLGLFSRQVPLGAALRSAAAFGPPYRSSAGHGRIVCAVRIDPGSTELGPAPWVLAAEVSLDRAARILRSSGIGRAFLLDRAGRQIAVSGATPAAGSPRAAGSDADHSRQPPLTGGQGLDYRGLDGVEVLGTARAVGGLGFTVLLEQPVVAALATARRLWLHTAAWCLICLVLALGGGVYLGRGVARPVRDLGQAAARLQAGDYTAKVPVPRGLGDELDQLGCAFNDMAAAVEESMRVIREQKGQLERWNEELQQRVEERTREVQDALQQVIRSQKLGAVAELGAGLAHELNNPLAGIMGLAQIAMLDLPAGHPQREPMQQIVEQGRRMRDIIRSLQRFSETPENPEHVVVDLEAVCARAIGLASGSLAEAKVAVELDFAPALPQVQGDPEELGQVVLHLVRNAIRAMPEGGSLRLCAREVEGAVRLRVSDTGKGIPPSQLERIFEPFYAPDKTQSHRPGLGLSVVHRVVSEHHGKITVRSQVGAGTEFTVVLPGRRRELHLT